MTIVIPFWDLDPQFLADAVESVLGQDVRCRVLVVDNASVVPLPRLDPRVEVVRRPERGNVGDARNAGLELVQTPWVMFVDADDRLAPGALPGLLAVARAHPAAAACVGKLVFWRPSDGPPRVAEGPFVEVPERLRGRDYLLGAYNTVRMRVTMTCCLLRTEAVRAAGGFSSDPAEEDWVLSAVMAFQGPVVAADVTARIKRVRRDGLNQQKRGDWRISLAARRELRRRLRHDEAVPRSVKAATPLIALLHQRPRLRLLLGR